MAKDKNITNKTFSLEAHGFYSDMTEEGMLYAVLIRSPASTGTIDKVEIPDMPNGYFLFTAKDISGKNKIEINGTDVCLFCEGHVTFQGEVIGILCGPDKYKVQELAENAEISFDIDSLESAVQAIEKKYKRPLIKVAENQKGTDFSEFVDELNELPSLDAVQSAKKLMKTRDSVVIASREIKTGRYSKFTAEEADKELFNPDITEFSGTWTLQQVDSLWQETSGAFCKMEKGVLHVYTSTKWSYLLSDILNQALGLKDDQIIIHKTKTSGMYSNGIYKNARLASQISAAAYLTGKPVKLVFTQEEQDKFMMPGLNTTISYKTGVTKEGLIKSMEISIEADIGALNPFAQEIIDRLSIASVGIYKPENLYIAAKAFTSTNPPTSVYPKIIDSQSFFALESHINQIIVGMNILPDEFRLINGNRHIPKFPFDLKIPNIQETLQSVIKKSDFNRKFFSFAINAKNRVKNQNDTFFALPLRGIGFSCGYEGSGYFGNSIFSCNQKMEVTLNTDDNFEIHTIKPSAVVENLWKKTVNKILQIPPEKIKINSEFPINEIPNMPEETNSNISVMTYLLEKCCLEIQKKRFHEPLPITSKKQISSAVKNKWNSEKFNGIPFHSTSFGAAVVEVELDSYTYMEKIKGIWLCVDCGEIFDVKAAERSLKLAVQQELACLVENERVTCDSYNISFVQSKESPGQLGELAHNLIPAAFASALSIALSTEISTLPVNQSVLYELIKERETEEAQVQSQSQPQPNEQQNKEEVSSEDSAND